MQCEICSAINVVGMGRYRCSTWKESPVVVPVIERVPIVAPSHSPQYECWEPFNVPHSFEWYYNAEHPSCLVSLDLMLDRSEALLFLLFKKNVLQQTAWTLSNTAADPQLIELHRCPPPTLPEPIAGRRPPLVRVWEWIQIWIQGKRRTVRSPPGDHSISDELWVKCVGVYWTSYLSLSLVLSV